MAKEKELLEGYCMKTKKTEKIVTGEIVKTSKGYMLKGETQEGNRLCAVLSKEKAEKALADGTYKRGADSVVKKDDTKKPAKAKAKK